MRKTTAQGLACALAFVGCAPPPLSAAGARVRLVPAAGPTCALVMPMRGAAGYNGRSNETNAADVETYLRNLAAERGADSLVVTSRRTGASWDADTMSQPRGAGSSGGCPNCITITANAYRCDVGHVAEPGRGSPNPSDRPAQASDPPFADRVADAAVGAATASARGCRRPGDATGEAHVTVTFAASGDVVFAEVAEGAFAGTPVGDCVARKFRNARVPAFTGDPRTLHVNVRMAD